MTELRSLIQQHHKLSLHEWNYVIIPALFNDVQIAKCIPRRMTAVSVNSWAQEGI